MLTAATKGASDAANLVLSITAIVVAVIAFVALLNSLTAFTFGLIGLEFVTFEWILAKVFLRQSEFESKAKLVYCFRPSLHWLF